MKLLVLSFYYQPDLSAGSFRCSALVEQLNKFDGIEIDIITTMPNRYSSFSSEAKSFEQLRNVSIKRVELPDHSSGMLDQARAFYHYYRFAKKSVKGKSYDAVYATSSRLFTAFLGARIAAKLKLPLYLDIRDIFVDTIKDVLPKKIAVVAKPCFTLIEYYTFNSAKRINLVSRGFEPYFQQRYRGAELRWFTNGIDELFLRRAQVTADKDLKEKKVILYAGNIGEGQGLHNIVPSLAKSLSGSVIIKVIGDGGRKNKLIQKLKELNVDNVEITPPVDRELLIKEYMAADILFLHLNDYSAFEKVLPSKIFEYAATGKPILAGVSGFAAEFIDSEVTNAKVFYPGNQLQAKDMLSCLTFEHADRNEFIEKYSRANIMSAMAGDIVSFVSDVKRQA